MGIIKDIKTGALPANEIPGFIAWAVRKAFWAFFILAVLGTGTLLVAIFVAGTLGK